MGGRERERDERVKKRKRGRKIVKEGEMRE